MSEHKSYFWQVAKGLKTLVSKAYSMKTNLESGLVINENYYAQAEQEIIEDNLNKGLWAKALVNVKGNEGQRKAEYIKLRARTLQHEFEEEQKTMREAEEAKRKAQQKAVEEAEKAEAAKQLELFWATMPEERRIYHARECFIKKYRDQLLDAIDCTERDNRTNVCAVCRPLPLESLSAFEDVDVGDLPRLIFRRLFRKGKK